MGTQIKSTPQTITSKAGAGAWQLGAARRSRVVLLGATPFAALAVLWFGLTRLDFTFKLGAFTFQFHRINQTFLPLMSSVLSALVQVFTSESYLADVWVSVYRVFGAFVLSTILALPIGLLAAYFTAVAELVEPSVGFVRYLPVPAFVPLCILWFGLGDVAKVAVIFLGTFFQMILLTSDVGREVPREYIEAALTLGARPAQVFFRVLWPASLPGIVTACRTAIGWAWTYLVVAEIAGATTGVGFRIMQAQRYVETPKVFAGIVVIGLLGMVTDLSFGLLQKLMFRWR